MKKARANWEARGIVRGLLILLGAAILLGTSGCASFGTHNGVEASLMDVRLESMKTLETTAVFLVRVDNADKETLSINGSEYRFYLNGDYIGKALSNQPLSVKPYDSTTYEVQAHLGNFRLATRLRAMIDERKIEYRLKGRLHGGRGDKDRSYSVANEGLLDANQFLKPLEKPFVPATKWN